MLQLCRLSLIFVIFCSTLYAQNVPTGFQVDTLVSSGLSGPHDFSIMPDGRILIAERSGRIRVFVEATGTLATVGTVPDVQVGSERGLLSICYDNGHLYTWSSRQSVNAMILSRIPLSGDLAVPTSANLSLNVAQEYFVIYNAPDNAFNHNGGTLRFGPDGMLYLSVGDDANCAGAQVLDDMRAVVLRMNVANLPAGAGAASVSALVPTDNPYVTAANVNQRLVLAFGLRNPFTFCVDAFNGDLFIGDVGQNSREELSWFPRNLGGTITPLNFGWPYREGAANSTYCSGFSGTISGLTDPIDDYTQQSGGRAIMVAGVVRNLGGQYDWGLAYEGDVFHNDYFNGTIERLSYNSSTQSWANAAPVAGQPSNSYWGTGFQAAPHFDLGPDGAIYFVQHRSAYDFNGGYLKRIRPTTTNPSMTLAIVSGDQQVNTAGTQFKHPLLVRVTGANGLPVANQVVSFQAAGSSAVSSPTATTNALGEASVVVSSTIAGSPSGQGSVMCTTPLGVAPVTANYFGRKLSIQIIQGSTTDFMSVNLSNTTQGAIPLPFLFALADPSVPVIPTIFGDLYVDLISLNQTIILEDGGGYFGFVSYSGISPMGTPSSSVLYSGPAGQLSGWTVRFQAIWDDYSILTSQAGTVDTTIGFTNPVTLTFP